MTKDTEEKIIRFLRTISQADNWGFHYCTSEIDPDGNEKVYYAWIKEHYDPRYVARDLLEEIVIERLE